MKILFFIPLIFTFAAYGEGPSEDSVAISAEGLSSSDVPAKARSDSLKEAINIGSLQIITQLIGDAKLEKNLNIIKTKILGQTSKYVQFYKASEPNKKGSDTTTQVNMKISISSLRAILAQEGLLYQSEGPATVLPLIRLVEKKDGGRSYRWWLEEQSPENSFLRDQEKAILRQFDGVFRPRNFYLIDPVTAHHVQWVPDPYRTDVLTQEDILWIGDFFKAQMVIIGDAVLEPGVVQGGAKLNVKLSAYHTSNGRVVGEIGQSFESNSSDWELSVAQVMKKAFADVSRDLSTQVFEEWTRGTFGATLVRVVLKGPFGYKEVENFRQQIVGKMGDVKTIRERRLEMGSATFEVDASGGLSNLVKRIEGATFDGFKVTVDNQTGDEVTLRWAKVGSR